MCQVHTAFMRNCVPEATVMNSCLVRANLQLSRTAETVAELWFPDTTSMALESFYELTGISRSPSMSLIVDAEYIPQIMHFPRLFRARRPAKFFNVEKARDIRLFTQIMVFDVTMSSRRGSHEWKVYLFQHKNKWRMRTEIIQEYGCCLGIQSRLASS